MKTKLISCIIILVVLTTNCSKKSSDPGNNNSGLSSTPTAKASYDNSNYGIYKGVFVGSTGYVIINMNNDNTLSATLKIDGVTYNFTSSQTIQLNQPSSVTFINGGNSFTFSVAANGANPAISNLVISGHPAAAIAVIKESSSVLVMAFEGTYKNSAAGGESGLMNLVVTNSTVHGIAVAVVIANGSVAPDHYEINGTVSGNQLNATIPDPILVPTGSSPGTTLKGTISGDNISGTYSNAYGGGNWSGKRTL